MTTQQMPAEPADQPTVEQALQEVLRTTQAMVRATEACDLEAVTVLMKEREKALSRAAAIPGGTLNGAETGLLRQIEEENARLMTALHAQRAQVARRLEGVRQERAIAAYRH